jgi:hypothetical protein
MEQKREFINVDTSENAKRLDVSGADGLIVIAVAVNIIFLMVLFKLA